MARTSMKNILASDSVITSLDTLALHELLTKTAKLGADRRSRKIASFLEARQDLALTQYALQLVDRLTDEKAMRKSTRSLLGSSILHSQNKIARAYTSSTIIGETSVETTIDLNQPMYAIHSQRESESLPAPILFSTPTRAPSRLATFGKVAAGIAIAGASVYTGTHLSTLLDRPEDKPQHRMFIAAHYTPATLGNAHFATATDKSSSTVLKTVTPIVTSEEAQITQAVERAHEQTIARGIEQFYQTTSDQIRATTNTLEKKARDLASRLTPAPVVHTLEPKSALVYNESTPAPQNLTPSYDQMNFVLFEQQNDVQLTDATLQRVLARHAEPFKKVSRRDVTKEEIIRESFWREPITLSRFDKDAYRIPVLARATDEAGNVIGYHVTNLSSSYNVHAPEHKQWEFIKLTADDESILAQSNNPAVVPARTWNNETNEMDVMSNLGSYRDNDSGAFIVNRSIAPELVRAITGRTPRAGDQMYFPEGSTYDYIVVDEGVSAEAKHQPRYSLLEIQGENGAVGRLYRRSLVVTDKQLEEKLEQAAAMQYPVGPNKKKPWYTRPTKSTYGEPGRQVRSPLTQPLDRDGQEITALFNSYASN